MLARHLHLCLLGRMPRILVQQDVSTVHGVFNTERARMGTHSPKKGQTVVAAAVYKARPSSMLNIIGVNRSIQSGSTGYDQRLPFTLRLPSWCARYPQIYCSVARFFRAADALAFLCNCSGCVV